MTTGIPATLSFFRGQTLRFQTTFYDFDGNVTQPPSANLIIQYESLVAGPNQELTIPMVGPSLAMTWIALLDTRNFAAPRQIQWSIFSTGAAPLPVAVQDGVFFLTANQANQPTF